ncbi:MAG: hypothetical protein NTZ97_04460 [Candidatus Moranbacteria bacterium]|nr:hypothetical protein [Candidatus Moranbacteria bacterium]
MSAFLSNLSQEIMVFYHSTAFLVVKIILGIYLAVIIYDLILLLVNRGLGANLRYFKYGTDIPKELATEKERNKFYQRWEALKKRLETGEEREFKIAIIEADQIAGKFFAQMGYRGDNFGERLEKVGPGEIENLAEIKDAHEINNQVVHDENLVVNHETAQKVLNTYETFFKSLEV